ncbi:MAG: hypothetical protein M1832_006248 [Thelocarpon impressellum]|nr:MAG: hypothetical protein M1832_006248 [Thelocarpon impressellum]
MRTLHPLPRLLLLVWLSVSLVAGDGGAVLRRQEPSPAPAPAPAPAPSPSPSPSPSPPPPPSSTNAPRPTGGGDASPSPTNSASSEGGSSASDSSGASDSASTSNSEGSSRSNSTAEPSSSSTESSAAPTSTPSGTPDGNNGTTTVNPNTLPLKPVITPAFAIAGVLLLLTGAAYNVVGIKNQWLHVFLSTAYLTSLAVTVLVIYVMNPPISSAIQGAYLVAAAITGIVFGALSLIFTEVTEGLGCLLGGFCLSMWLLVLKPGGLLTETGSKAIFIAAFTLAVFALSFHRYTRTYSLMGSTAFSGATVVVLGMDCLSKAGLKEFWVYIWALNDNLFPLATNTYPHTRGIRVEIAAIMLIFVLGIISQLKLWKVVKQRRAEKAAERKEHERHLDRLEEDVGRRVEEHTSRERAQWEDVYGNKERSQAQKADSGIGEDLDSRKGSSTVVGSRETPRNRESIELSEIGSSRRSSRADTVSTGDGQEPGNTVTVRVVADDSGYQELDDDGVAPNADPDHQGTPPSARHSGSKVSFEPASGRGKRDSKSGRKSGRSSAPPAPAVVPLPFSVPEGTEDGHDDDQTSVATFADSIRDHARRSKRLSGGSALNRLSVASSRLSRAMSESQEALVIPHDDDRASSIAATIDDLTDDGDSVSGSDMVTTPVPMPEDEGDKRRSLDPSTMIANLDTRTPEERASLEEAAEAKDRPMSIVQLGAPMTLDASGGSPEAGSPAASRRPSLTPSTNPKEQGGRKRGSCSSAKAAGAAGAARSKSVKSGPQSEVSAKANGLDAELPKAVSKVVMSYRTNEWAKHLSAAEKPQLDELKLAEYPVEAAHKKREVAAPVDVDDLQQTADTAKPPAPALSRSVSQLSLRSDNAMGLGRSASASPGSPVQGQQRPPPNRSIYLQTSPQRSASQSSVHNASGNPSAQSLMHSSMSLSLQTQAPNARGFRSSSSPLLQETLVESPTEETGAAYGKQRLTPSPLPSNTLMAKRDTMLRAKYSSNSLPGTMPEIQPSDSASVHGGSQLGPVDEDDMTLSERRALMQQQQQQQQQPVRASVGPMTAHSQPFDSHQPRRESAAPDPQRREAMLAQWRQSVQQEFGAERQQAPAASEFRRAEMLHEKHASRASQQQAAMASKMRDSVFDERMRRGDMIDLHKEALRKMQANANKHV